jgi:hypothetical protein
VEETEDKVRVLIALPDDSTLASAFSQIVRSSLWADLIAVRHSGLLKGYLEPDWLCSQVLDLVNQAEAQHQAARFAIYGLLPAAS